MTSLKALDITITKQPFMKQTTLEYYKFILERVSFDAILFEKEFRKAISNLPQEQVGELKAWVKNNYAKYYSLIG